MSDFDLKVNPKAHNICQPQMNEFESDESKNLTAGPAGQEGNNTIVKVQLINWSSNLIQELEYAIPPVP